MIQELTRTMDTVTKQDIYIKAAPEAIYDALSTGEAINVWFTRHSQWVDREGAEMTWSWENWGPDHENYSVPGHILVADRPCQFTFEWGIQQVTTVNITIEPAEGGSIVRVRQHGYQFSPAGLDLLVSCSAGWGRAMTMLKYYLEYGIIYETLPE